jgi:hypothetical protein
MKDWPGRVPLTTIQLTLPNGPDMRVTPIVFSFVAHTVYNTRRSVV